MGDQLCNILAYFYYLENKIRETLHTCLCLISSGSMLKESFDARGKDLSQQGRSHIFNRSYVKEIIIISNCRPSFQDKLLILINQGKYILDRCAL